MEEINSSESFDDDCNSNLGSSTAMFEENNDLNLSLNETYKNKSYLSNIHSSNKQIKFNTSMSIDSNCLFNIYNSINIDENYNINKKNIKEDESDIESKIQKLSKKIKKLRLKNKAPKAKNNIVLSKKKRRVNEN